MQQDNDIGFTVTSLLQPTKLTKKRRLLYRSCAVLAFGLVGLVGGLFFGLVEGLVGNLLGHPVGNLLLAKLTGSRPIIQVMIGPPTNPIDWLSIEPVLGAILGPICGLMGGLENKLDTIIIVISSDELAEIIPEHTMAGQRPSNIIQACFWSWKENPPGLIASLVGGIVSGLSIGLICGPFLGIIGGMIIGLAPILLEIEPPEGLIPTPNETIWRCGKTGLRSALSSWLMCMPFMALFAGLLIWLWSRQGDGLFLGMLAGLFLGPFIGLVQGLSSGLDVFVKHFVLRFILWLRDDLPWDLIAFLDEATERLLLRRVGRSYIFVHRILLDYFAELREKDEQSIHSQ